MKIFTGHLTRFIASIFVGLFLVTSVAHAATLLTNGSFETPVVPVGSFSSFAVGSSAITGWTVVGPAGTSVSPVSGTFAQNGVAFIAQDGVQWLDLTGFNINSTEGVAQTVGTTVGNLYQLSYFVGNTTGGGIFGTTSTVNVSITGVAPFSDTNSTASPTAQNWQQFTHTFVAAALRRCCSLRMVIPVLTTTTGSTTWCSWTLARPLEPFLSPTPMHCCSAGLACSVSWRGAENRITSLNPRLATTYIDPALAEFHCVEYWLVRLLIEAMRCAYWGRLSDSKRTMPT